MDDPDQRLPSAIISDYLSMLDEPGVPPHELHLKEGAVCALMRNLFIDKGLVKNARIRILHLGRRLIYIQVLRTPTIRREDVEFYLPRISFDFQPRMTNWTVQRRQFPLRLAYATTFNSCQGLTLDRVVL
ncbi:hypothetical protein EDB80DRAFT_529380, partial [Ilyonectria destructans]